MPRVVTNADLFRVRWLDDPQISADGWRIAFTVSALDRERDALITSVYVCDAAVDAGESATALHTATSNSGDIPGRGARPASRVAAREPGDDLSAGEKPPVFRTAAWETGGVPAAGEKVSAIGMAAPDTAFRTAARETGDVRAAGEKPPAFSTAWDARGLEHPTGETWQVGPDGLQCRSPRWSPDGRKLSVLAGQDGAEQLWILAADGSGARRLAHAPGGVSQACWSPDGQRIAYVAAGEQYRQLWTMGADGADATCISDGGWDDGSPAWSPDGKSIAFLSRRDSAFADIWLTRATSQKTHASAQVNGALPLVRTEGMPSADLPASAQAWRLTDGRGPIRALAWSPDSRSIAYIGHAQGHAQGVNFRLYVIGSDGWGARELCAGLDRSIGLVVRADDLRGMDTPSLAWSPDGRRIYFAFADGGVSHIGWASLDGQSGIAVDGERACLSFTVASKADRIAFIASDPQNPGEVYTAAGAGQCERRVTGLNESWLGEVSLSTPEQMRFVCDDGQTIEGWLLRPPGWSRERRYPLILQIHGGPHYPLGERFYFDFQRLAAMGYIVLYCNPRGSQGYGEQFATCNRGAWGERDARDLMQAMDSAAGLAEVDEARLAVTGVSYGGYMTNWLIGHTQRFRVAICENGISNLASNFGTSVHGAEFWTWELNGTPASELVRYRALSPLSYADRMHTPLLLIHAEQDENCAIAQSEELHGALEAFGRSVSLVRIPGEGHLMNLVGRPSARLLRMEAIDEWLERWMGEK